jgi:hypothetical protein
MSRAKSTRTSVTSKPGSGKSGPRKTSTTGGGSEGLSRDAKDTLILTHRSKVVGRLGPVLEIRTEKRRATLRTRAPKIADVLQHLEAWVREAVDGSVAGSEALRGLDIAVWHAGRIVAYVRWDTSGNGAVGKVK